MSVCAIQLLTAHTFLPLKKAVARKFLVTSQVLLKYQKIDGGLGFRPAKLLFNMIVFFQHWGSWYDSVQGKLFGHL